MWVANVHLRWPLFATCVTVQWTDPPFSGYLSSLAYNHPTAKNRITCTGIFSKEHCELVLDHSLWNSPDLWDPPLLSVAAILLSVAAILLHVATFLCCISLHFSIAFRYISLLHFAAFLCCILLHFSVPFCYIKFSLLHVAAFLLHFAASPSHFAAFLLPVASFLQQLRDVGIHRLPDIQYNNIIFNIVL